MPELACPLPLTTTDRVLLGHGGGGRLTRDLIAEVFLTAFGPSPHAALHDAALLPASTRPLAFTTDSFVVQPLFFPGGDLGTLAVCGTVNDLAMAGARPLALSAAFILEEGCAVADLRRVVASMAEAARHAGVRIVTGDTKVVERGKGDSIFVTTTGVGEVIAPRPVHPRRVQPGDVVIVSGTLGQHGVAVMARREGLAFAAPIVSDCASVAGPALALLDAGLDVHCMRDPTRGGVATTMHEIATAAHVDIALDEDAVPVSPEVEGACEVLGLDPLYVACEGRFVAMLPPDDAREALDILHAHGFTAAARIGTVHEAEAMGAPLTLRTRLGSLRVLDLLSGEQLPRIC